MEDKSLELLTEEERRFHEEFTSCQNMDEIEELEKRLKSLNESRADVEFSHFDMTADEFCKKYGLVSIEEIMERNGIL